ncbi:holo-ACP synthase [Heyndrickxia sporothermodurans]|uniref:holo-ACP synthase n=1 Tax=Heyndrickxia TaxID=2837504 RepID=UPI000D35D5C1|nr:holo-ACP synthase [Heyndrickxia sporothermodurans]MEB6550527.1 holo-ACP synthase [Heyndrickxia sporothermodurans]PTY78211.1 holo-ACP synthase [Heyndrickxia sporothermodurans]
MIQGIGIDIIEIDRIHQLRTRQPRFPEKILTESELELYLELKESRKSEYLAGRFAAKEAFSKAMGTGIGKELSLQDMEIMVDNNGKPYFRKPHEKGVHLSITHSKQFAAAQVVIETI